MISMSCSVLRGDNDIDGVNNLALRNEIGEQLRVSLDQRNIAMPPNFVSLVMQMRLSDVALSRQ